MNSLAHRFETLQSRGEKGLVLFLTAGDQPLGELRDVLTCLAEAGADAIEVGIPFSDPFGEGPTIQQSSQRALDRGTSLRQVLDTLGAVSLPIPLVAMGYYNPILRFGLEAYAAGAHAAGITGTIISDLVPDEADRWMAAAAPHGHETIFLAAPTSTAARLDDVCARTTGFVYAVSRTGVTGAENAVPPQVVDLVAAVKARTPKPVCVGFGISKAEHVRMVCGVADGAVVGSALVHRLHDGWDGGRGAGVIATFVRELKAATHA
ncbi:MAG: tryptophan synthase subunit alpha [Fimbriimonadaceae bacterium]|nr:tryptophan synthase subunit alpha [Fimbriimonadaceae bacterium]